jgi:hypothetical protein
MPPPSPHGCLIEAACTHDRNHLERWLLVQMRSSGPLPENTADRYVRINQVLECLLLVLVVVQLITFLGGDSQWFDLDGSGVARVAVVT